jgi:murein L,D-transpeptidase YcbB/YkuD
MSTSSDQTFLTDTIPSGSVSASTVGVAAGYAPAPIANPLPPASTSTPPFSITSSTSGMTISQMETLLASLESELQTLEAQAGTHTGSSTVSFVFTRDLELWSTGNDVKQLQLFLIAQNAGPAAQKLKAHGVTTTFGTLTLNALIEFQKSVGITPASGYFGPITRGWVKGHQ